MLNHKLLSSLFSVKSVLCINSLSLWRYSLFCAAHWRLLCGRPFPHSDDSTVVMNVKDDARVGQKTASDSIDSALLRWFALLLGTHSNFL